MDGRLYHFNHWKEAVRAMPPKTSLLYQFFAYHERKFLPPAVNIILCSFLHAQDRFHKTRLCAIFGFLGEFKKIKKSSKKMNLLPFFTSNLMKEKRKRRIAAI